MGSKRTVAAMVAAVFALGLGGCASSPPDADASADVELYVQHRLDTDWKTVAGSDRPPASSAKFVLPNGWNHTVAECMVEAGFATYEYDASTGESAGMNDPQLTGVEGLAWYTCLRSLPQYDVRYPMFTPRQLEQLYNYYTGWLVPCLLTSGYSLGAMPTHDDFVAGWETGRPGAWNPYLSGPRPFSTAAAALLFDRCRPYPATL